jgi:centromere protein J
MTKKNEPIVPEMKPQQQQQQQRKSLEENNVLSLNASLLKEKLHQLETEIDRFQRKNIELAKMKEKCECELRIAETARKAFEKEKNEELKRMRENHCEEMRKLKAEKKIFEQYKQSIKEGPDRRERDDIEKIKQQVSDLNFNIKLTLRPPLFNPI